MVDNRWAVANDKTNIYLHDLRTVAPVAPQKTLSAPSAERSRLLRPIPESHLFLRENKVGSSSRVELFCVNEDGVELIAQWQAVGMCDISADSIASIEPTLTHIELRDPRSGKLQESVPTPVKLDATKDRVNLHEGTLVVNSNKTSQYRYFNWVTGEKYDLPANSLQLVCRIKAAGHLTSDRVVFYNRASPERLFLVDADTNRIAVDIAMPLPPFQMTDGGNGRLAISSQRAGGMFAVVDASSGDVLSIYRPYSWVLWLLPVVLIAGPALSMLWIRASARDCGSVWLDVLLVSAIALVPLVLRSALVDVLSPVRRLPLDYCQGIYSGLMAVLVGWLVFGNSRFTSRVTPLLLAIASLAVALTISPLEPGFAAQGALWVLLPTFGLLILLGLARLCGVRVRQCKELHLGSLATSESRNRHRVPLRDYFVIAALVAIVLACSGGLLKTLPDAAKNMFTLEAIRAEAISLIVCAVAIAVCSVVMLVSVVSNRVLYSCLALLILLSYLVAASLPIIEFWIGSSLNYYLANSYMQFVLVRVIGAAVATIFILMCAFRLRGWRVSFRPTH